MPMLADIVQADCAEKSFLAMFFAWIYHVSPALLAVTLGGYGVNRFFIRRANASALADRICADLKSLSEDLLSYWSYDPSESRAYTKNQVLAQKIKGSLHAISRDLGCFAKQYHPSLKERTDKVMAELMDAATGGTFETSEPIFNPPKYLIIVKRVGELRSILLETKL